MNEIQTIRDALELGLRHKDTCLFDPETCTCFAARTYRASKEALSLLPPEGQTRPDLGICLACHSTLDPEQIERMGESWGHVVPVMGHDGPEPSQCGPVKAYYKKPAPSSEKALAEALAEALADPAITEALGWMGSNNPAGYEITEAACRFAQFIRALKARTLASAPAPEAPKEERSCATCGKECIHGQYGECADGTWRHWIPNSERSATT